MERTITESAQIEEPLVELAPEEAVLPALLQSAHPVEFIEVQGLGRLVEPHAQVLGQDQQRALRSHRRPRKNTRSTSACASSSRSSGRSRPSGAWVMPLAASIASKLSYSGMPPVVRRRGSYPRIT